MTRTASKRARALLVAQSPAMRQVVQALDDMSQVDQPVLITGERGTGRELVARILHATSSRQGMLLVAHARAGLDGLSASPRQCTSKSTFRAADGGTLLIKELSELPRSSQKSLLATLRRPDAGFDVRIVASSDLDLGAAVGASVFRQDLFQAFQPGTIEVPSLRQRVEDIPVLAAQFIRSYGKDMGRSKMTLSTRGFERLTKYPWPGNVAELKSISRRLVLRVQKSRIEAGDVDAVLPVVAERVPLEDMSFEDMVRWKLAAFLRRVEGYPLNSLHGDVLSRVERPMFDLVMEHTGGNQLRAAEILGINRNTLRRKLAEHQLCGHESSPKRPRRASARTRRKTSARNVG